MKTCLVGVTVSFPAFLAFCLCVLLSAWFCLRWWFTINGPRQFFGKQCTWVRCLKIIHLHIFADKLEWPLCPAAHQNTLARRALHGG